MKAAVYYKSGDIRIEERSNPFARDDNLIIKVKCCAICGTDLKIFTFGSPRIKPPRIIGHEFSGEIVHVGLWVKDFKIGDRVTLATTLSCGVCDYCKIGLGNLCPNSKPISLEYDGAFAEYLSIPPIAIDNGNVIKIPNSLDYESAAISEPLSCAINAQGIAGVKAGDNIVIVGGGPLGAIHAELAKATGANKVIIVDICEERLKLLKKFRDITLVNSLDEDVYLKVTEETNGMGADVVIVCAPNKDAMENSLCLVRKGGCISLFASIAEDKKMICVDSRRIHYGELRIVGSSDSRVEHVLKAVKLLSEGKIDTKAIITHKIYLEDIFMGFDLMRNRDSLKVLVFPKEIKDENEQ